MKCDFCDRELIDGEMFFDPTQANMHIKVVKPGKIIRYEKLFAICEDCVNEMMVTIDEVGEEIDAKMDSV